MKKKVILSWFIRYYLGGWLRLKADSFHFWLLLAQRDSQKHILSEGIPCQKSDTSLLFHLSFLEIAGVVSYFVYLSNYNEVLQLGDPFPDLLQAGQNHMLMAGIIMVLAGVIGTVSWVGTLINLGRAQKWAWFILTIFFGPLLIFIYLIAGPKPLQTESRSTASRPIPRA